MRPSGTRIATSTPETIAEHWSTITDRAGYSVPMNLGEETALFLGAFT